MANRNPSPELPPEEANLEESSIQSGSTTMESIAISIRSSIPGLIKGLYTIPMYVPLNLKWMDVFRINKLQIGFIPMHHILKGRGSEIDVNTSVLEFYLQYQRKLQTYQVDIVPRTASKIQQEIKRKVIPKGKCPPKDAKEGRNSKRHLQRASISSKRNQQVRSQHFSIVQRRIAKLGTKIAQTRNATRRRLGQDSLNVSRSETSQSHQVVAPLEPHQEDEEQDPPVASTSTSAMNTRANNKSSVIPPPEFRMPQRVVETIERNFIENPLCRDEDTMDGEILQDGEFQLKTEALSYISNHFSNRDMLVIREELETLKRQKKVQSLNRLVPFTAGFLMLAFTQNLESSGAESNNSD